MRCYLINHITVTKSIVNYNKRIVFKMLETQCNMLKAKL